MSKRPRPDLAGEVNNSHKKPRSTEQSPFEAYNAILGHADEFISCLQALKKSAGQPRGLNDDRLPSPEIQLRLSNLSKALSPSFQQLAIGSVDAKFENSFGGHSEPGPSDHITKKDEVVNNVKSCVPDLASVTPWIASEISSQLPPLPQIPDPEIEAAVFRHPGLGYGSNYERLEWLGDAYLEMIATNLIFKTFGETPAGRCSQIREQLVRNVTLAGFFRQYGMESRAQLPSTLGNMSELLRDKSRSKDVIKVQGDMFEAFVAAVVVSDSQHGLKRAVDWLKALWGNTIRDQIVKAERTRAREKASDADERKFTPKERLANAMVVKGIHLRYEDMPGTGNKKDRALGLPLFSIGLYLDGWGETNKFLGVGTALQKKEAGQKAAAMALENKQLMKLYREKKRAFLEAQTANGPEGPEARIR